MEEKNEEAKSEHTEHVEHKAPVKKDPFSTFGKIAAVIIVIALLLGGGYYLGGMNKKQETTQSEKMSLSPTEAALQEENTNPSPTSSQTKTTLDKSTTAGGASGTNFGIYAVDYPSTWTEKKEKTDITDKLTLTKGDYSISIYQAPMGGGGCLYPGDKDVPMAQNFKNYVEIQGAQDKLRRSWSDEGATITYTVCQKGTDMYGSPTSFGAISVKAPNPLDKDIMKEIDMILASLTKK